MFHAAGWTFPWANVFAFATQVCMLSLQRTPSDMSIAVDYITDCGLYPYLESPTSVWCNTLLWCANGPGTDEPQPKLTMSLTDVGLMTIDWDSKSSACEESPSTHKDGCGWIFSDCTPHRGTRKTRNRACTCIWFNVCIAMIRKCIHNVHNGPTGKSVLLEIVLTSGNKTLILS
jgi:hypothetical protein